MDEALCRLFDEKRPIKDMCAQFGRSEGGVTSRLVRLGKIHEREEVYTRRG